MKMSQTWRHFSFSVRVVAWLRQALSHYLNQWRKRPIKLCNVTIFSDQTILMILIWFWCSLMGHCSWVLTDLTHCSWVMHICVDTNTNTGSDNGLSPGRRQAIIWTNAGILLIRTLGTNFSEILGEIHSFSFKKMHLKMSSAKGCLYGLGLNELCLRATNTLLKSLRFR